MSAQFLCIEYKNETSIIPQKVFAIQNTLVIPMVFSILHRCIGLYTEFGYLTGTDREFVRYVEDMNEMIIHGT